MLEIISSKAFKTIPWKNGLGETTELAINDHASLDNFIWRLSIASVVNDGVFSDFSGYHRNLVLIDGNGLSLHHDDKSVDVLENILDMASFDGGCITQGHLFNGPIKDFNIITDNNEVTPQVHCYIAPQQVVMNLSKTSLCFAYSLLDEMHVETSQKEKTLVSAGHLVKLSTADEALNTQELSVAITGKNMIIVQLELKSIEK